MKTEIQSCRKRLVLRFIGQNFGVPVAEIGNVLDATVAETNIIFNGLMTEGLIDTDNHPLMSKRIVSLTNKGINKFREELYG